MGTLVYIAKSDPLKRKAECLATSETYGIGIFELLVSLVTGIIFYLLLT